MPGVGLVLVGQDRVGTRRAGEGKGPGLGISEGKGAGEGKGRGGNAPSEIKKSPWVPCHALRASGYRPAGEVTQGVDNRARPTPVGGVGK
jgi:hypothetical protein